MAMLKSLVLLGLCLVVPNFGKQNGYGCPGGFKHRADAVGKCYAVFTEPLNWDAAQAKCNALYPQAHLVVINSALENEFVSEILNHYECKGAPDRNQWFWTSGRRSVSGSCSSPYVWKSFKTNNQAVGYTNFCPKEPDCIVGQDCVTFAKECWANRNINGWQNDPCGMSYCPICEFLEL